MTKIGNTMKVWSAFAVLVVCAFATAAAEDLKSSESPAEFAKVFAQVSKPGPEHAKLEPLAGEWMYTSKFWMDPSLPPMESKGTISRKWILGGRFLEEKIAGTNFDGTPGFEGLGLVGYDIGQKKYTSSWACSMGTGTCNAVGVSEKAGSFTFESETFCPIQKEIVKGREVLRFEGNDKTIAESYVTIDGKEMKVMEIVAVRKK